MKIVQGEAKFEFFGIPPRISGGGSALDLLKKVDKWLLSNHFYYENGRTDILSTHQIKVLGILGKFDS